MKKEESKQPTYDLSLVKRLVSSGSYVTTKKSTSWLRSQGYRPSLAKDMILSLDCSEFCESKPPDREGGAWADVYRCDFANDEIEGLFYLKFVVSSEGLVVVLMSCKEWGYGW